MAPDYGNKPESQPFLNLEVRRLHEKELRNLQLQENRLAYQLSKPGGRRLNWKEEDALKQEASSHLPSTIVEFMFRIAALLFSLALVVRAEDFSLDRLFSRPYVWGTSPSQVTWAKHAHILGFLWNAQGQAFRDLYIYNADSKVLKRLTDLANLKDPINDGEAERDIHRQDYLPPRVGLAGYELSEDGSKAVFSYRGDLSLVPISGGSLRRLTKTKAPETNPQFSPDGNSLAYLQSGQLYVMGLNGGMLEQRTDVKPPAALVNFHWSPDGKQISYAVAPQPGRMLPLPIYSGQFVTASPFARSVAGDSVVSLQWFVTQASGDAPARPLDAGKGISRRASLWSPDSKYLLLVEQAPNFKSLNVWVVDVNTGKSKVVFHQEDDRWVELPDIGWDQTGKRLWLTSDQSGYQHLYTVSPDGSDLKQLTHGAWEIHNDPFSHSPQWIGRFDLLLFNAESTTERQFYRVKADGSSPSRTPSEEEGLHIGWVSETAKPSRHARGHEESPRPFVEGKQITKSPQPAFYPYHGRAPNSSLIPLYGRQSCFSAAAAASRLHPDDPIPRHVPHGLHSWLRLRHQHS